MIRVVVFGFATLEFGLCMQRLGGSEAISHGNNKRSGKPHIVLVLADDMGYNGIGYNNKDVKTPTLDKLANEGVTLRSFYGAPICTASRFSLLTGRDAWKSEGYLSEQFGYGIESGTDTRYNMLPVALKAVGYKTHMVGKWHLGHYSEKYHPQNRGFDTFYGALAGCTYHQNQRVCEVTCDNGGEVVDLTDTTEKLTVNDIDPSLLVDDRYKRRAIELIRSHDTKEPMFLYVAFHIPHHPLYARSNYSSQFNFGETDKNTYFGMFANLDDNVEGILKALKETSMWEDTLFIFSSDNGGSIEVSNNTAFLKEINYPLSGFKGDVDEGGIKVPAFVSGGFVPAGAKGSYRDGLTSIVDWYATLANLVGAKVDNNGPYLSDSIDNWKYITGESSVSARKGLLQYRKPVDVGTCGNYAYIEGALKLTVKTDGHWNQLFDLETDPSEEHDLSNEDWGQDAVVRLQGYVEQAPFMEFLERVRQLWTCADLGYSDEIMSSNLCQKDSTTFLTAWRNTEQEFGGCV